jgi:hypothetical protein
MITVHRHNLLSKLTNWEPAATVEMFLRLASWTETLLWKILRLQTVVHVFAASKARTPMIASTILLHVRKRSIKQCNYCLLWSGSSSCWVKGVGGWVKQNNALTWGEFFRRKQFRRSRSKNIWIKQNWKYCDMRPDRVRQSEKPP